MKRNLHNTNDLRYNHMLHVTIIITCLGIFYIVILIRMVSICQENLSETQFCGESSIQP